MRNLPTLGCLLALVAALHNQAADIPGTPPAGPLSPREEQATFRVPKGFKVELAASEPQVVDPVAMAFDEDGRLFVAEMPGYPNGGLATGQISSGKIKLLEDRDGDGFFEKSTVFADGLRLPTSVMPWKGGLLVANAPELIYLEDSDGDGKSDKKRVLYTGFDLDNIQQLLNGLQWGLDNWVHGVAGGKGGVIQSAEKPDAAAVTLRGRGVRFHPDIAASLEPTSGGGQFGLAADDWGHWFTATNSQHLRHIVLPDHYLRRNPYLPVSAVTLDIPDHGAACQVHRISPFEAWRVERTTRRKDGSDSKRFSPTELVPGGFITSACSPCVYTADRFPAEYRGHVFVCDPANNLIHRDILEPNGATFKAKRGDADCEFLASTDTWFRPAALTIGPDGAMYVLDFYREVIETPLSLPEDIQKKLNLESRTRGRVWRITTAKAPGANASGSGADASGSPRLRKAPVAELVPHLASENSWWRLTAQRLLVERQDPAAVPLIEKLVRETKFAPGRAHALWTLHGQKALKDDLIELGLKDESPGVRRQALRLAEDRLSSSAALRNAAVKLVDDPSSHLRFQLAFSLGEADTPETALALAKLFRRKDNDTWTQTALLSSAGKTAPGLLEALVRDADFGPAQVPLVSRLAGIVGARAQDREVARVLDMLGPAKNAQAWQAAMLEGLGQGLQQSGKPLRRLWEEPPVEMKLAVNRARPFFAQAATTAANDKIDLAERVAALRLLGHGPFATGSAVLQESLAPRHPAELQMAAVRALALHDSPKVAEMLLGPWGSYSPAVRREVVEGLFARPDRLRQLLTAVEKNQVPAAQLEIQRLEQLRKHPDAEIRKRAAAILADRGTPDRKKIVDDYRGALDLTGDVARGRMLFQKTCATCHRLENVGFEVGADLMAALKTKTREGLLVDILDPSREVDPRYVNYIVTNKAGKVFTGMLAVDAPSSITLRRAEKAEDSILRDQIDEVQATAKSVMPDELEKQLAKQDLADVIAYLLNVVGMK